MLILDSMSAYYKKTAGGGYDENNEGSRAAMLAESYVNGNIRTVMEELTSGRDKYESAWETINELKSWGKDTTTFTRHLLQSLYEKLP